MVGGPLSLIRDRVALVREPVALIRDRVARIRHPVALVGDPCRHPGLSSLATSLIAAQPGTFALKDLIIGLELRRSALNL